ncbi:MFS transporter [Streptomyces sp. ST2-7A]|uniref:MFS transporter n=1 Tax=Streptomyces sp. ST2-7A TaxID=2907214 RepID=UPI001F3C48A9|nr:MFS transporter [Streptomyces sp. ST2-7A]MCE7081628.1 MFS transporter [Streptomyces sp. ST2-7A]
MSKRFLRHSSRVAGDDVSTPPGDGARPPTDTRFHGWRIVGFSAVALAMTAPGQTHGISVMIDPLIEDLGIGRTQISTAYLIGTLVGACAMPMIGRAIDRWGPRLVMAIVGAVFGAVLLALSAVSGVVGLTAGFVGIRMAGQGALSLVATTTVAYWFDRRRGFALGLAGALGTAGISTAPVVFERLIAFTGWRETWAIQGLLVWAVVIPIAVWGIRNRPADIGQHVDGVAPADDDRGDRAAEGWPLRAAMRTGMFWVIVGCLSTSSMLGTGLAFHQIDILGERGLSTIEAAANFLPQTAAVLLVTIGAGFLVDRFSPRLVLSGSMVLMACGIVFLGHVSPGFTALGYGVIMGAAGGMMRTVESAAVPRYFGTTHLGAIRGVAHTGVIAASALGPVAVALGRDVAGDYSTLLIPMAVLPVLVAVAAAVAPEPRRRGSRRGSDAVDDAAGASDDGAARVPAGGETFTGGGETGVPGPEEAATGPGAAEPAEPEGPDGTGGPAPGGRSGPGRREPGA